MIYRGEIYLIDFNNQIGCEQIGTRPAIVVQNDIGNMYSPTTIVCPITTRDKVTLPTHVKLSTADASVHKNSIILCEQVRVIDKKRIKKKLGKVTNELKIKEINQKILVSFGIS